jgi:transposase
MQYIAFDAHKHYTWAAVESPQGKQEWEGRITHERGAIQRFLQTCEPGSPVAVETIGNWYWIVDEIEAAQMVPRLVHALKAKLMMGALNKTDKLDAQGINRLQRSGTLPTVWIPPASVRDARELPRTRMVFTQQRARLKNRLQATLAKYALTISEVSDVFGVKGRRLLQERIVQLPAQTRFATEQLWEQFQQVEQHLREFERRMKEVFPPTPRMEQMMSLPGVGFILAVVIIQEVGDVQRFPSASHLAAYAGTTPRVQASGGKVHYGSVRHDVNHYLKWAFGEAANVICRNRRRRGWSERHVSQLYERIKRRRGHAKAIGAVARHLAEATYWVLKKEQFYREPGKQAVSSTEAQARLLHEPTTRLGC